MSYPFQTELSFLGAGVTLTAAAIRLLRSLAQSTSPFRVSVINDEISQDFDHACHVAAVDFGC